MICPGCQRDVPDLFGPDEGLCPRCHGITAEDLMPSLHEGGLLEEELTQGFYEDEDAFGEFTGVCPGPGSLEDDDLWAEANEFEWIWEERPIEPGKARPTFRGRRRF